MNIFMDNTLPTSAYSVNNAPVVDLSPGPMKETGNELDVAINGQGFFVVRSIDPNGSETQRLTRRGDLTIDSDGDLANGAGHKVLSDGGMDVARRTVAKYRDMLNIPSSAERRRSAKFDKLLSNG